MLLRLSLTSTRVSQGITRVFSAFQRHCLQGGRATKGPELVAATEEMGEGSPSIAAAFSLELPSPKESTRTEKNASAAEDGVRFPAQLMQKLWAWVAYRMMGAVVMERTGFGGGDGVSAWGRGQTTASQVLPCSLAYLLIFYSSPFCSFAFPLAVCGRKGLCCLSYSVHTYLIPGTYVRTPNSRVFLV